MYDEFSEDYDRFVNWPGRLAYEMPFLEKQAAQAQPAKGGAARILDTACGTGWHAIALGKLGYAAAGCDLSAGMVAKAQQNAAAQNLEAFFFQAGFGEIASKAAAAGQGPFDLLLCLGNSLPHVLDQQALQASLEDFNACLRPGGYLLIQNRNFETVLAERQRWMEPQAQRDGNREWVFLRFYDFRPDGLIDFNVVTLHRTEEQPWQQQVSTTQLYPLRQPELTTALASAGFTNIQYFGDMRGGSYTAEQSGNLVVWAQRG